jgi:hypothetical protein
LEKIQRTRGDFYVFHKSKTENQLFLMPLILLGYLGNIKERQNREAGASTKPLGMFKK